MYIVEGDIKLIGHGSWGDAGGGGSTEVSAFEIGNQTIKKLEISDYLHNYFHAGDHARVFIAQGISRGAILKKCMWAIEVDGKKYTQFGSGKALLNIGLRIFFYTILSLFLLAIPVLGIPLAIAAIVYVFYYYINGYRRFLSF